ncbi:MAG: winged helix-turn-helix domain-containing protein [Gammaproteobacteria bacterium]
MRGISSPAAPAEANPHSPIAAWRLGDLRIDLDRRQVSRDGAEIRLPALSFDLLVALVAAAPKVLSLDALMDRVWPGVVVGPETVNKRVTLLREALGDDARQPRYIASVRGRGYRIVAPATPLPDSVEQAEASSGHIAAALRWRLWSAGAVVAAVIAGAFWYFDPAPPPQRTIPAAPSLPSRTVAVLPFLNLSAEPEREYIAIGIAEAVLHQLASLRDLTVIARTSSFAFKGQDTDVREIGRRLNARYLLEGSVQSVGDRLRVTAQLVDAATGGHVWSLSFDRPPDDVFAVQDEIAARLAESFALSLDGGARNPVSDAPPNPEAYQRYMIGREIMFKRDPDFPRLAAGQFEQAIAIDPQYAEAHAELALVTALTTGWERNLALRQQQAERAQEAIDNALALKPNLARAYVAQGLLQHQRYPPDNPGAEAALRKALALEPNMVDASSWLANALKAQGRRAEAFAVMERAARIDPLASPLIDNLAMAYADRGEFARAEQTLRRLLDLPQPSFYVYWTLVDLYFNVGRLLESNDMAKRLVLAHAESGDEGHAYPILSLSYSRLGLWAQAEYWAERNTREWPGIYFSYEGRLIRPEMLRLQGRFGEIAQALQAALETAGTEITGLDADFVLRFGTLQTLAGRHEDAVQTLEPVVNLDAPGSNDWFIHANAYQALAWAYRNTGTTDRARRVLQELERRYRELQAEGVLHLSKDLFLFAQNAVLAGDEDRALDRLRQAVDAGWRDYYSVDSDPRWQSVRDDPRFKGLMSAVKADIDAQRARVEIIDAKDNFVARLDEVLADSR